VVCRALELREWPLVVLQLVRAHALHCGTGLLRHSYRHVHSVVTMRHELRKS